MFGLFKKKNKKVRVLVVVDGDSSVPVDYYSKIDVSMPIEVRVACNSLAIAVTEDDVKSIVDALCHGETYWLNKAWGFQVIEVQV